MNIYTRTGDDGSTGLFGGDRLRKFHLRIEAYGTVDETNAALGLARALLGEAEFEREADDLLASLQHDLFVLGGDLAAPGAQKYPVPRIQDAHVELLEAAIDQLEADLPPLKHFILPGGSPAGASLHLARTTCRRAERLVVELADREGVSNAVLHHLNRLSDLLFVLARWVNHHAGSTEEEWRPIERGTEGVKE